MQRKVYTDLQSFLEQKKLAPTLEFSEDTGVLSQSVNVAGKTAHNRLACQAMEGCDGNADGTPSELTERRYDRFAKGGSAIIWFEATAVLPEGRANPRQLYINDNNLDAFARQVEKIKEAGLKENGFEPLVFMQATHSGRYSKPNGVPEPIIAYNNPIFEKDAPIDKSRIATDEYLDKVGDALVYGATLAQKAGFDGVDIKCCHRYLNSELLSAFEREGRYGGSFENRTRLLRESVKGAIQNTQGDFIVSSRLNVYDGFPLPYGFGVSEGIEFDKTEPARLIKELYALGMPIINITMGNPYFNPHVNRPFANGGYTPEEHPIVAVERMLSGTAALKRECPDMLMICSALSYLGTFAPNVAAGYIEKGGFDFAGFGRTIFAYPDFANDILGGGLQKNKLCICCSKCTQIMRAGGTPGCVIRDPLYTKIYKEMF